MDAKNKEDASFDLKYTISYDKENRTISITLNEGSKCPNSEPIPVQSYTGDNDKKLYEFLISNLRKKDSSGNEWTYFAQETTYYPGFRVHYGKQDAGTSTTDRATDKISDTDSRIIRNDMNTVHLPATGGVGTNALYALGGGLVLLAALGWVLGSRKRRDDEA